MQEREDEQPPVSADEQEEPPPVRPTTPQEDEGESLQELEDPPQAEGDRDDD